MTLADEFQPFIRPSVYCDYDASSKSTQLANNLSADAQNEGDVVRGIYDWIVENIAYDEDKAARLADATGYLPNPGFVHRRRLGNLLRLRILGGRHAAQPRVSPAR